MFVPTGFFASAAANYIPVEGYSLYMDFGEEDTITKDGSNYISLVNDISTNGYTAEQTGSDSIKPKWNDGSGASLNAGYLDGSANTGDWYLDMVSADAIFDGADPSTNPYTIVVGTDETSARNAPFGLGGGSDRRVEFFYNDSSGRRDIVAVSKQYFFSGVTNDSTKDTILFAHTSDATIDLYRFGTSEANSTGNAPSWASDTFDGGTRSRIGSSARGRSGPPFYLTQGFQGRIYFLAVYPSELSSADRSSIKDWAVDKWGLTLQV